MTNTGKFMLMYITIMVMLLGIFTTEIIFWIGFLLFGLIALIAVGTGGEETR